MGAVPITSSILSTTVVTLFVLMEHTATLSLETVKPVLLDVLFVTGL